MKRMAAWVVAFGCAATVLMATAESAKEAKAAPKSPPAPPAPQAAAAAKPAEKVAYTFSDQVKVEEFAKLWQQRQATVLRMTVLRSYFQEEQATLEKLNEQFAKNYNLDVTKNYRFDNERRVIIEMEASASPESQALKAPEASPKKGGS